ncbi:MAG: hypothetical protein WAN14_15670 [Candidatus Acidiferrales bacterium]
MISGTVLRTGSRRPIRAKQALLAPLQRSYHCGAVRPKVCSIAVLPYCCVALDFFHARMNESAVSLIEAVEITSAEFVADLIATVFAALGGIFGLGLDWNGSISFSP